MSDMTMREAVLVHYRGIDLLRDENAALRAEIDRLRRILAALREPSDKMLESMLDGYGVGQFVAFHRTRLIDAIRAAVAAAEQEVGRDIR